MREDWDSLSMLARLPREKAKDTTSVESKISSSDGAVRRAGLTSARKLSLGRGSLGDVLVQGRDTLLGGLVATRLARRGTLACREY